jgi:hypothetical protein
MIAVRRKIIPQLNILTISGGFFGYCFVHVWSYHRKAVDYGAHNETCKKDPAEEFCFPGCRFLS